MHCQHSATGFADRSGTYRVDFRCLPRFGRCAYRSNDPQCFGGIASGDIGAGATIKSLALHQSSQGPFSQVSQNCHRSHVDSVSWSAASGQERNLPQQSEERHNPLSRLRYGSRGPQGSSIHLGAAPRRTWHNDEGCGSAAAQNRPPLRRENPISPAGQGVFQRRDDHLFEACAAGLHHSGHGSRPQTEGPKEGHRPASDSQEKERLLSTYAQGKSGRQAALRSCDHLRGEQKIHAQKDGRAPHEEVDVRRMESPAHAARDSRNVPQAFWYRGQLSADARSTHQDLYTRSEITAVVYWHRAGAEKHLGVAALQASQGKRHRVAVRPPASLNTSSKLRSSTSTI